MTTSKTLANTILELSFVSMQLVDHMKLQKLMFFSHGYHLAMVGTGLSSEGFEAWPYGPVNRSVYSEFREFGASPINTYARESSAGSEPGAFVIDRGDTSAYEVIKGVWERFRGFTAIQLSDMTHQPDTPWSNARQRGELLIPDNEIRDYFQRRINAGWAY